MARIPRKTQKIFAGNWAASPFGQLSVPGTYSGGGVEYSGDLDVLQDAAFQAGWANMIVNAAKAPAMTDFNSLAYIETTQLANILQDGVPVWDSGTTYYLGSYVQAPAGISGVLQGDIYRLMADNTGAGVLGIPITNTAYWVNYQSYILGQIGQKPLAKAWVTFNGVGGATIIDSYNVTSVTRVSAGQYILQFPPGVFANSNYAFSGSCGTPSGGTFQPGDDNSVVGGCRGRTVVKSPVQLTIFLMDPYGNGTEDSQSVSVVCFGS